MNIVVVYNPKSGSALPKADLEKLFADANITVDQWVDTTKDLQGSLRPWKSKKCVVAAIGGDGTIASVADILHGGSTVLAPLPGGTLNHFTKDAGINQDLAEAIKALPQAKPRTIDLATVNGTVFLNNSSIGLYPVSLQTRKRFEDRLGKWTAAVVSSIRAFILFRLYEVTMNGTTFKTPFIFVGNNQYRLDQGWQRSKLDQGVLSVYAIQSDKRRTLIWLIGAALKGKLAEHDDFMALTTTSVTIHTKRDRVHVSTDGEVIRKDAPLRYECTPGGLTIIGNS